ncbi:MAG: aminopeptidase P family protein [Clostridiales bacterium]|nr:aminopeptidase P family protein [Clostridiales bacterium]
MFETGLIRERMDRAYGALNEFGVDLWISISRETHFTTEPALMFLLPAEGLSLVALLVGRRKSVCVVGPLDAEEAEAYGAHSETITAAADFDEKLVEAIRGFGPLHKVALNFSQVDPSADGLSLTQYRRLTRCLEAAGFKGETVSSAGIMKRVRGQKGPREVEGIRRAVQMAMGVYEKSRGAIRSGMSGYDIQQYFQEQVHLLGAGYSWPQLGNPFVSVGTRSSYLCKRPPADVFLQPGDLVNVDFGLRLDGFASDNQRSYYVLGDGETAPPQEVRDAFFAVQEAIRKAVVAAGPGVHTTVPLDAANAVFERLGFPNVRGLGHELGTFAHEGGMRMGSAFEGTELDMRLEEGMTFTMEPAIITSHGRLCQEEVVVITKDGCRMLSTPQEDVWLVR